VPIPRGGVAGQRQEPPRASGGAGRDPGRPRAPVHGSGGPRGAGAAEIRQRAAPVHAGAGPGGHWSDGVGARGAGAPHPGHRRPSHRQGPGPHPPPGGGAPGLVRRSHRLGGQPGPGRVGRGLAVGPVGRGGRLAVRRLRHHGRFGPRKRVRGIMPEAAAHAGRPVGRRAMNPEPIAYQHVTHHYVGAFVDELVRSGLRHVCLGPGSRSTPLALLCAQHPELRVWVHVDERSAAFFALGMARTLGQPVALVCTSGTAAANFLPAVVEACLTRVPLVVLTADRPHELRDVGAAQTIDQVRLYGSHVKWFVDMALPEATTPMLRYARAVASRAVALARDVPAGPVHVNFPLREPLVPLPGPRPAAADSAPAAWWGRPGGAPYTAVAAGPRALAEEEVGALAAELAAARRVVLVCGPDTPAGALGPIASLARRLGCPVLADPLSGLRTAPVAPETAVIDAYDVFLRDESAVAALAPDLIVRFGALPVSKPLLLYMERYAERRQWVVDPGAQWRDPILAASRMIY